MSDYSQTTDFSAKDALTTGDPEKIISGADVDVEFAAISVAIASKVDEPSSPSANDLLRWTGSAWSADALPQIVEKSVTNYQSTTSSIAIDDTIPQNTEGYAPTDGSGGNLEIAITPVSATSKLRIDVDLALFAPSTATVVIALFQDATANALAAIYHGIAAGGTTAMNARLTHFMTSGTTSATTFKVRIGTSAGTLYMNGNTSSRLFGGVMASRITVMELPAG